MKVLLVYPKVISKVYFGDDLFIHEPLSLEYVAAGIVEKHDVMILDMRIENRLEEVINEFKPDVIGFTSLTVHVNSVIEYCKKVKILNPSTITFVGGHHASISTEDFNNPMIDIISIGEGVMTVRELIECLDKKEELSKVKGIAYRENEALVYTDTRPYPGLDEIPFPVRSLTEKYRDKYFNGEMQPIASLRTSKGCPFKCKFCCLWKESAGKYYTREPKQVIEELKIIKEPYIFLADDESMIDEKRMERLAELIIEEKIEKKFYSYVRADTIIRNKELMRKWRDAGLVKVHIGMESFREKDLKEWDKKNTTGTNEQAIAIMNELGISVSATFIISQDYDESDFDAIADYSRNIGADNAYFTILTPLPGTELYDETAGELLTHDYDFFDCLHTVLPTKLPLHRFYGEYAHLIIKVSRGIVANASQTQLKVYMGLYNRIRNAFKFHVS